MAVQAQRRATKPEAGTAAPPLRLVRESQPRRSFGDIGTLMVLSVLTVCLLLAGLHAVHVQNQASLDDLVELNQLRAERINELQAQIAYLDSPEGLAEQAASLGLVPAPDVVVLSPVAPGLLEPPGADPFGLADLE